MTNQAARPCGRYTLVYGAIALLCLLSTSTSLETYLFLPAVVWVIGGTVIAGGWAYEKYCRFETTDGSSHDCSACGVFGHKLPWVLLIGSGLGNLANPTTGWSAVSAYAVAVALFSLSGSFFMMRVNED